jgi:uncharacterized membrane protein
MPNPRKQSRVKAALIGAFLCALLGPTLGAAAMLGSEIVHEHEYSVRACVSALSVLPFVLPVALMLVGPEAFVLGGVGALVIQFMSTRVRSARALALQTAVIGLVLGGAVPGAADLVYTALWGDRNKNFETGLLWLGAVTGLVCAVVVYWLLHRTRLIPLQHSHDSETV